MTTTIQRSFAGGEITPSVYGRVDQTKYQTGLRTCRNFIVMRHGGLISRPGTIFVAEAKDSSKTARFIPFIFNADQTYVLEFGDLYMRVIKNGQQLAESPKTITGITNANPGVVSVATHGYTTGEEVFISGVAGMTEVNGRNFKVGATTAGTFELEEMDGTPLDTTSFGTYSSGGTSARVYEIATPYLEADLPTLQFAQSADVITIVHPSYAPRDLSRTGDIAWSLSLITVGPTKTPPGTVTVTTGAPGSETFTYHVTGIDKDTGEESLASIGSNASMTAPTVGDPHIISWPADAQASEFNVYRVINGVPGFIGVAQGTSFEHKGEPPDIFDTPPVARDPFPGTDDFPSTVTYYQQRRIFGNTNNNPETIYGTRSKLFKNFTVSTPLQDDDAVTFNLLGNQVNAVRHLLGLRRLLAFSSGAEWVINGDANGVLLPSAVNPEPQSYYGSSTLPPIPVGNTALFFQSRGSVIRDIGFDFEVDGYRGNEITIFAAHLFDDFTLKDRAFQQIPHSVVWVVRSDGVLLGLTFVREHQVWAWHRHDFEGGVVENVVSVPEGNEDAVYLMIKRTINGKTVRYIEKFASRLIVQGDIVDNIMVDSALSFDGRNTGSTTMTLSGGTTWAFDEKLTLTASASEFSASDVGNEIHVTKDGVTIRFKISSFTSPTVVEGFPHKTVPASLQSVAVTTWAKAVDQVGGLWHLEGENVSVQGDRFVVASPNNPTYDAVTVTNGTVTLDKPYSVIHVGLPFTSDFQTLDLDTASGETIVDKAKLIQGVTMFLEESRGIFAGPKPPDSETSIEGLQELKIRSDEGYDDPVELQTGVVDIIIRGEWNRNGRVFVRQVDPIPLSILSIATAGYIPLRG